MSNVKVIGKVKCPYTKDDFIIIEKLCEDLIDTCSKFTTAYENNVWVRTTAHDITDVLIDLKVDLKEAGEKHGYADNIINMGKKDE